MATPVRLVSFTFADMCVSSTGQPPSAHGDLVSKPIDKNDELQLWVPIPVQLGLAEYTIFRNYKNGGYAFVDNNNLMPNATLVEYSSATIFQVSQTEGEYTMVIPATPQYFALYWSLSKAAAGTPCTLSAKSGDEKNRWSFVPA